MRALQQATDPKDRVALLGCAGQIGGAERGRFACGRKKNSEYQAAAKNAKV